MVEIGEQTQLVNEFYFFFFSCLPCVSWAKTLLSAVPIPAHHLEKAQRVTAGMDLADLVGVDGCDWD